MRWSRNATSSAWTFFTRATHSLSIVAFEMRGTGFPAIRGSTTGMISSPVTGRIHVASGQPKPILDGAYIKLELVRAGNLQRHLPNRAKGILLQSDDQAS